MSAALGLIDGIGDGAASAVAAVINLTAFGGAVFRHPVGAAFGAADIVAMDARAGHADTSLTPPANEYSSITSSYATGTLTAGRGDADVGALVGLSYYATVTDSYGTGQPVRTDTKRIGLFGEDTQSPATTTVTASYWDIDTITISDDNAAPGRPHHDAAARTHRLHRHHLRQLE